MRVLIKKANANEFYRGNGQWTARSAEAKTYSNSIEALRECSQCEPKTEIVFSFPDPRADIKIPCGSHDKR